jgi:two-component system, NarL family, response regulator
MSDPIRVLCVDDHRLVLEGISLIVGRQIDMTTVGSATSVDESVTLFRQYRPDITLMDLRLGKSSGVDAIRAIRGIDPDARIIVLTMYHGDEDVHQALDAGAATYLLKDAVSDDLVRVIRQVHAGEYPVLPVVEARLAERANRPTLTKREVQIVELISTGMRNKEIAAALGISEQTVHVHLRNLFAKLEVTDRSGAVHVALRRGIIHVS